jgi:hypothetical protein
MTHKWEPVDVCILPEVTRDVTVLVEWRDKGRQAGSVKVKTESKEWRDIRVSH